MAPNFPLLIVGGLLLMLTFVMGGEYLFHSPDIVVDGRKTPAYY